MRRVLGVEAVEAVTAAGGGGGGGYFDYNATTPVREEVVAAMAPFWRAEFANAASGHAAGRRARAAVEEARERVAAAIEAHPSEVIFTASGTESNNTIIKGVARLSVRGTVAVSAVEHPCVLCAARSLRGVAEPVFLAVDECGRVEAAELEDALRGGDCALVSVMAANNETGVLQEVAALAALARAAGTWFHCDAAQAMGKVPLSFSAAGVDAMTLSGHKFGAPKGVAALVVRREVAFAPLLEGGGHQEGRRSGTENVPGIVGFGVACERAAAGVAARAARFAALRDGLEARLTAAGAVVFGARAARLPNTSYFGFPGIDGDALVTMLDQAGFAVAAGAACASMKADASHVLLAMEVPEELARTAVRFSLGEESREDEVRAFGECVTALAANLRGLSAVGG